MKLAVGFLGFGEVASIMATGLWSEGVEVVAYDILAAPPLRDPLICRRASELGVKLVDSLAELAVHSQVIFSAVVPSGCLSAARATGRHVGPGHLYLDLNSVSPSAKRLAQDAIEQRGARYVDAAVMAAVPRHGHRVPLLLAGRAAAEAASLLAPLGMQLEVLGTEVGQAAAVKMLRSILTKGTEALLLECLLAAAEFGVTEGVFTSATESMSFAWAAYADYTLGRCARHSERRACEMEEVSMMLKEEGIEPMMAVAAARRFRWASERLNTQPKASEQRTSVEIVAALQGKVAAQ
jgi:3-hydroxyisobutyrate dehydrogenase-like beta-hydroxyacid dehydrogenase